MNQFDQIVELRAKETATEDFISLRDTVRRALVDAGLDLNDKGSLERVLAAVIKDDSHPPEEFISSRKNQAANSLLLALKDFLRENPDQRPVAPGEEPSV